MNITFVDAYVQELAERQAKYDSTLITLSPRYKARWDFAMHMYTKHILKAMIDPTVIVMFDGMIIPDTARLNFNTYRKEITLSDGNVSYGLFNGNPEYDEGVHDTLTVIESKIKSRFTICKKIDW